MKTHTSAFKTNIKELGRQIDVKITYDNTILGNEEINSLNYNVNGDILKSVMKQLEIDSNVDIPLKTEINVQIGLLVNGTYEYLNYGNFIVEKDEKQEDKNSYILTCYDKLIVSMTDYQTLGVEYPITIRDYLDALCTRLELTFASASDNFVNYDKEIPNELYLDNKGNSIGYTYRDILDELAQVTASTICINEDDELEVRYVTDTGDTIDEEYLKNVNVNFGENYGPINTVVLSRSADSDKISLSIPQDLPDEDKIAVQISDNQILNGNDRDTYMVEILNKLYGLQYCVNDYSSTGILYYDLCDRYNVKIGDTYYPCVMFNDEINLSNGLVENITTEQPKNNQQEYKYMDSTDRRINQAYIKVDKQNTQIEALTQTTSNLSSTEATHYQEMLSKMDEKASISDINTVTSQVNTLQTDTYKKTEIQTILEGINDLGVQVKYIQTASATFNEDGMTYNKSGAKTSSNINEAGFTVNDKDNNSELLFAGYDEQKLEAMVRVANLYLTRFLGLDVWRIEIINDSTNGKGLGFFYIG